MKYYGYKDIMELCNVSQSTAYVIIRKLNDELIAKGYIVPKQGQVPVKYANERLMLEDVYQ